MPGGDCRVRSLLIRLPKLRSHRALRGLTGSVWIAGQFEWFHRKAEASFAHSKRFAHYDITVHVGASMFEGATEPRGSPARRESARSLLALWRVGRQCCSLRGSFRPLKK